MPACGAQRAVAPDPARGGARGSGAGTGGRGRRRLFDEETPRELIAAVLPDVLVKGADWSHFIAGREEVEAAGGKVSTVPLEPGLLDY